MHIQREETVSQYTEKLRRQQHEDESFSRINSFFPYERASCYAWVGNNMVPVITEQDAQAEMRRRDD